MQMIAVMNHKREGGEGGRGREGEEEGGGRGNKSNSHISLVPTWLLNNGN